MSCELVLDELSSRFQLCELDVCCPCDTFRNQSTVIRDPPRQPKTGQFLSQRWLLSQNDEIGSRTAYVEAALLHGLNGMYDACSLRIVSFLCRDPALATRAITIQP